MERAQCSCQDKIDSLLYTCSYIPVGCLLEMFLVGFFNIQVVALASLAQLLVLFELARSVYG